MPEPKFPTKESEKKIPSIQQKEIDEVASRENSSEEELKGYKIELKDGSIRIVHSKKEEIEVRQNENENQG